jgi:hypothetical protein
MNDTFELVETVTFYDLNKVKNQYPCQGKEEEGGEKFNGRCPLLDKE